MTFVRDVSRFMEVWMRLGLEYAVLYWRNWR